MWLWCLATFLTVYHRSLCNELGIYCRSGGSCVELSQRPESLVNTTDGIETLDVFRKPVEIRAAGNFSCELVFLDRRDVTGKGFMDTEANEPYQSQKTGNENPRHLKSFTVIHFLTTYVHRVASCYLRSEIDG